MKKVCIISALVLLPITIYYFYPEPSLPAHPKITRLVVDKRERVLKVYAGNKILKTYRVALGKRPTGSKECKGDYKTPEGLYYIDSKNPFSGFHKNLGISYPAKTDRVHANQKGVSPGGQIKIHGLKNGFSFIGKFHRILDWTAGCIAVTDEEIDELYELVPTGTPIFIMP